EQSHTLEVSQIDAAPMLAFAGKAEVPSQTDALFAGAARWLSVRKIQRASFPWVGKQCSSSQTYLKFQRPLAACSSFCVGYPKRGRVLRVLRSTKTKAASSMR